MTIATMVSLPAHPAWRPYASPLVCLCLLCCAGGSGGPPTQTATAPAAERLRPAPEERVLYLVLTDRFANGDPDNDGPDADPTQLLTFHGGDFAGLTEQLPYLAGLGVTTIWINPIVEQIDHPVISDAHPPHWGYHGYWAEHFDRLEPRFGDADDLRALLDAAHAAGLELVLDVVLNHSGYGSHFADDSAWTRTCLDEGFNDLNQCLFGLPDFRTEDPAVASQLIEWQVAWFRDYPFDGLRADTVKHVETAVWRDFLAAVRAARGDPNFWALGESWGTAPREDEPLLAEGLFDAMYDFEFSELVESFLSRRMRAEALAHHLERRNDLALGRYVHYLDTHDTELMTSRLEDADAYPAALVLLLTSAGIPLLYYGDELAREGGAWPHNRPDMPWERAREPQQPTLALTRQLLEQRRVHPALTRGGLSTIAAREGTVVFAREAEGDRVVVGVNRGPEDAELDCAELGGCQPVVCHLCRAESGRIVLEPYGAFVLEAAPSAPSAP